MDWVWGIFQDYVNKLMEGESGTRLDEEALFARFLEVMRQSTVTVLVQIPWQNSIRFKGLARYPVPEAGELLNDPPAFLHRTFGGGKFKLNFHHGWHFVGTRNFRVDGEPQWQAWPEIDV